MHALISQTLFQHGLHVNNQYFYISLASVYIRIASNKSVLLCAYLGSKEQLFQTAFVSPMICDSPLNGTRFASATLW